MGSIESIAVMAFLLFIGASLTIAVLIGFIYVLEVMDE